MKTEKKVDQILSAEKRTQPLFQELMEKNRFKVDDPELQGRIRYFTHKHAFQPFVDKP